MNSRLHGNMPEQLNNIAEISSEDDVPDELAVQLNPTLLNKIIRLLWKPLQSSSTLAFSSRSFLRKVSCDSTLKRTIGADKFGLGPTPLVNPDY